MRGTTSDSNRHIFFAKIKGLKKDDPNAPYIEITQKQGDKYMELDKCTFIEGWLSGAKTDSYEYEGKQKKTIELVMEDGIEKYIFQTAYTQLSRSLINSLLGTKDYGRIKISVYTNKAGFKSIFVENNGEKMSWKYPVAEFQAKAEVITKKSGEKVSTDYTELDNWLEEQFKLHVIPNCKPNPNPYVAEKNVIVPDSQETEHDENISITPDPISDLPF